MASAYPEAYVPMPKTAIHQFHITVKPSLLEPVLSSFSTFEAYN